MTRRARKKPASLKEPKNPIHVDRIPRKRQKLFYRLRVVCQEGFGRDPGVRDVYLESSRVPHYSVNSGWTCLMCGIGVAVVRMTDLLRWFEQYHPVVIYQPAGNMENHLNPDPKRPDQQSLFS